MSCFLVTRFSKTYTYTIYEYPGRIEYLREFSSQQYVSNFELFYEMLGKMPDETDLALVT